MSLARWRMPPRLVAAALGAHSALGLAFGALIYLVCLTGTLSVLVDELKLVEQPAPAAAAPLPGAIDRSVASLLTDEPAVTSLYAVAPTTAHGRLTLSAYGPGGERDFIADANGGLVPQRTPFTDFVTDLHMTLTAPAPWGSLAVGLAGAALLALIVSGVLAHPRIFRDAFRLRLNGSRRLREAELHNRLSVWGLPFHVTVTLTGALFGLADLAIVTIAALGFHGDTTRVLAPIDGLAVRADSRPAPLPDLETLVARAKASVPGSTLYYIGVERPGTRGARIAVEVSVPRTLPRGEDFYFDAQGRQIGRGRFLTGPVGLQAYSAAAQLHFGFFGGVPVRIAYVLLGAALTFVAASGVGVWLERREERGRATPRLRAAWRAWTRGTPAALAVAALASGVAPVSWTFWCVVLLAQGLAAWRGTRRTPALPFAGPLSR